MHCSGLALFVLALAAGALAGPFTPDLYWPTQVPAGASSFTAVAVDNIRMEVYVAQRSANYSQPILVFDKLGSLLRSWGKDTVSFSNGWGVHGLNVIAANNTPYIFVADTGDHTVKKYVLFFTNLGWGLRDLCAMKRNDDMQE